MTRAHSTKRCARPWPRLCAVKPSLGSMSRATASLASRWVSGSITGHGGAIPGSVWRASSPVCTAPLRYSGHDAIRADIDRFKSALAAAGAAEGFMTAVAPASCARIGNRHYKNDEEFLYACAEAMREEYQAIVEAGLVLQLDDPCLAEGWDQVNPEPSVNDYRALVTRWIEALNHAIRGLPQDRIRLHLCWGSWHGPHVTDIPIRDILEAVLKANVGASRSRPAMSATSMNGRCGARSNFPTTRSSCPGSSVTPPMSSNTPNSSPTGSCALPSWSGASGSSPRPIAALAAGSIPRSPGPSSRPSPRVQRWPAKSCGADPRARMARRRAAADPPSVKRWHRKGRVP